MITHRTNVALAEETAGLSGGRRWRGVLNLRRSRRARLAHGVGAVHYNGVVVVFLCCRGF